MLTQYGKYILDLEAKSTYAGYVAFSIFFIFLVYTGTWALVFA